MTHDPKKSYMVSYPRSGKTWLGYCCDFILEDKKQILYQSHYLTPHLGHSNLDLTNNYNNISILLVRNYKDAIFSNLLNTYSRQAPINIICNLAMALQTNGCEQPLDRSLDEKKPWLALQRELNSQPQTEFEVALFFNNLTIQHSVDEFLLDGYPRREKIERYNKHDSQQWHSIKMNNAEFKGQNSIFEALFASSWVFHYHFALQMQRYYNLLDYYDKKTKTRPNETLLITYEDFMSTPEITLNNLINFWEKNSLLTYKEAQNSKHRVEELVNEIEYHRQLSLKLYKQDGHLATTQNPFAKKSPKDDCSMDFLTKIDDVFKRVNTQYFEKYLTQYAEDIFI